MTDEIVHHGIIGMKWGVRRTPEQLGHTSGGETRTSGKNDPTAMSDEELDKALVRLRKETEFKRLQVPTQEQKGFASKAAEEVGKKAVAAAITAGVIVAGNAYLKKQESFIGPKTKTQAAVMDLVKEAITRIGR